MSNTIIVNGQKLKLDKAGGAGKYSNYFYFYLSRKNSFLDKKITLVNFEQTSIVDRSYLSRKKNIVIDFFFRKKDNDKKITSSLWWENIIPFYERGSSILLHELTNYSVIDEIGQLCLLQNLFLIVTFLDIQDIFYPQYFTDKQLSRRRLLYSFYKERADFFLAISNFTKQTMVDFLKIPEEKIIVTHLAADDLLFTVPSNDIKKIISSLGRYWIYPAKAWLHKNHIFLFQALGKIKNILYQKQVKLVLTGGFKDQEISTLKKSIRDNKLDDAIHILGFISDSQLQALIKGAEYLVFPSLFEGFGMPILEAMTLGCPVISSNAGSLPEVGGDAAVYFDPKDKDKFSALLESLLLEKGVDRNLMIKKGFENSKRFSWDATFRKTVEVYNTLLQ